MRDCGRLNYHNFEAANDARKEFLDLRREDAFPIPEGRCKGLLSHNISVLTKIPSPRGGFAPGEEGCHNRAFAARVCPAMSPALKGEVPGPEGEICRGGGGAPSGG